MFRWIREKDKDKEEKKRERKERKHGKDKDSELTQDELKHLEEVRRNYISCPYPSHFQGASCEDDPAEKHSDSSEYSLGSTAISPDSSPSISSITNLDHNAVRSPTKKPPPVPKKPPPRTKCEIEQNTYIPHQVSFSQGPHSLTKEVMAFIDKMNQAPSRPPTQRPPPPPAPPTTGLQNNCIKPLSTVLPPGEQGGFSTHWKSYSTNLHLPVIVLPKPPHAHILSISRQATGDFGFSLRRASITERRLADGLEVKQTVVFAEPSTLGKGNETGLLPGDRLLEVNDISVESKSREEIIELIRSSGNSVKLKVQPVTELSELTLRLGCDELDAGKATSQARLLSQNARRKCKSKAKSEEQLAAERAWLQAEKVWVMYKGGFAGAYLATSGVSPGEGKVWVKLEDSEELLEVNEEDVEKANPPQFDRTEDFAHLRYLNESSILFALRQRYAANLIHTYSGRNMLIINPQHPVAIYSEKVMKLFKTCRQDDMPPHIYSVAQTVYNSLLNTRRDQSIVFLGRSGSGKTTNMRHLLQYFTVTSSSRNILTVEKLNAVSTLLEAFGNCRTIMNTNASRFTELFSLDFDHSGQIVSASVQVYLLERSRVSRRPEGEPNFHVFYHLLAGVDENLRKELYLDNLSDVCLFMTPLQRVEDQQKASLSWMYIKAAMQTLSIQEKELQAILNVLAAIYHLGVASASRGSNGRPQFTRPQSAQKAASLLGTSVEELTKAVFNTDNIPGPGKLSPKSGDSAIEAVESLQAMAAGLYAEVFSVLLSLINNSLSSSCRSIATIHLLDLPGFQNPASCGRQIGGTLEDLCHNYCHERLQLLFHDSTFLALQERYAQENIAWDTEEFSISSPSPLVNLIDQTLQGTVRTSDISQRGILWLLDEESIFPGGSEKSFVEKVFSSTNREQQHLIQQGQYTHQFVLQHFLGTNPVTYSVNGWIRYSRESPAFRHATMILQHSQKECISQVFNPNRGACVGSYLITSESSGSLRRTSSIRRGQTITAGGVKRRSFPLQVKYIMDGLCDMLKKTHLHFVHCLLPQHNAGLCDLKSTQMSVTRTPVEEIPLNIPLLRSQLRGFQILDAVRVHKQGFPEHLTYSEFRRRFELLAPSEHHTANPNIDEKIAVEKLLENIDVDKALYRLGLSQVFLRSGTISLLESQRDEKLNDVVIQFQAVCRGYITRNKYKKLKVQDMAIRCIQRNVRIFLSIRSWHWWRLLVKVMPLLNVHRTEEELRAKTEELENLRTKVERLEKERNELKHNNDKLEARVSELWSSLNEEQATATHVSEMLESEISERMKLEKEVLDLQGRCSQIQHKNDCMEMEVMEARTYHPAELNGDVSDEDETNSVYRQKYERALREIEITKRRLQQQHDEEIEHHLTVKKAADKKLVEALEDLEEERRVSSQWKRKAQKANSEIQDQRIMLEEQMARNAELEKKQRKFDAELSLRQDEITKERFLRDKVEREKDMLQREKYSLEQELHSTRLDMEMQSEKIVMLHKELEELAVSSRGEEEVTQLKRVKQELERKFKDQEEELEELTGQLQMLEQVKLRLEMSLEKARQEHRREISVKEEEIEEVRAAAQKKVKNLEAQLEAETEERHQALKQKHELERRIIELSDQPPPRDPEIERRLRRDLKRTKALLRDAQMMLERLRDGQANKSMIRQLKNQLEDAEFTKTAAIKARQGAEMELQDLQCQFEEISRTKSELESRCLQLSREKNGLQTQLEEMEEELAEVMKKYKAVVYQMSSDQKLLTEQNQLISELEAEKQSLKEQLSDLSHKMEHLSAHPDETHKIHHLEGKLRDQETKLELEQATRARLESQLQRLKEQAERGREECDVLRNKETQSQEGIRKLQRQLREAREDYTSLQQRESEAFQKQHEVEMALENAEADLHVTKNDLRLACQRIQDLQHALEDNGSSGTDVAEDSGSESDGSVDLSLVQHHRHYVPINWRDSISSTDGGFETGLHMSRTSSVNHESPFSRWTRRQISMEELSLH